MEGCKAVAGLVTSGFEGAIYGFEGAIFGLEGAILRLPALLPDKRHKFKVPETLLMDLLF